MMLSMADFKGSSSAVFCQKENQQPVMQTSSNERPHCLMSSGGHKKPARVLQRDRIPSYFYEGPHQKCNQQNASKEFEGLSNIGNLQYDKLRSKRYSPSKAIDEVTATYDKIERQMLSVRPPPQLMKPSLLQAMQSNKQSLGGMQTSVPQGKSCINMSGYNKNQNQSSETTVEGNSMKVGNYESIIIQPAMIEVLRSSKEKLEHTESDTEVVSEEESSCECGIINGDKGDGPPSGYYRQAKNQTVKNEKLRNEGKYQQSQQALQETKAPVGYKGQFKRNDRQNIVNKPTSENDNLSKTISDINDNSKKSAGRPYSAQRNPACAQGNVRHCPINWQDQNKKSDNDMNMSFTAANGKEQKVMSCPTNRTKSVPYSESILLNDENSTEQTKPQKTKVSLDSVVIQAGAPTVIRVHQNRNSELSPQDSGEDQQNESDNEKEYNSELYDQISSGDNQQPKLPEYNTQESQMKNSNGYKAGSNEKHPMMNTMSNRKPIGERNNQKVVTNDSCQDQSQPCCNNVRYQTQPMPTPMHEGKFSDQISDSNSLTKTQAERLPPYYKKPNRRANYTGNNVWPKLPHQTPMPPTPLPSQYQAVPSKRAIPQYIPQHFHQPCTVPPEYYQCPPPTQNQLNLRKYKSPPHTAAPYHLQPMHCRPSPDIPFAEPMHQQFHGLQYQQYMYPTQQMPIPPQPYGEQYPVHNPQQCLPDANQYQQMQYEQQSPPGGYQEEYGDSVVDAQYCENFPTQQYMGEHVHGHGQYDYYNNNQNYYPQGGHQNYCTPDYYDNGIYE